MLVRETRQNKIAADLLRKARSEAAMNQTDFAREVGRVIGVPLGQSALSGYETAGRAVPGAVLVAAAEVAGLDLVNLIQEAI